MAINTQSSVFLGVVVQPKTKAPVYAVRRGFTERTVDIYIVAESSIARRDRYYVDVGSGYLHAEADGLDSEYDLATKLTGFPRVHTPDGLKAAYVQRGGGYGASLYTSVLLLAVAHDERELVVPNVAGRGPAICSDENSRSMPATRWWRKAVELKLAYQEEGDVEGDDEETETETLEDEDLEDYMSMRGKRSAIDTIVEAITNNGDWYPRNISIRGDLEREVPVSGRGGYITADVYPYERALKANLVAVRDCTIGQPIPWAKYTESPHEAYKNVILALNVANEDSLMVARLAKIAQDEGATERELAAFMMRNRFGVDTWRSAAPPISSVRDIDEGLAAQLGEEATKKPKGKLPTGEGTQDLRDRALDMMARAGTVRQNPAPVFRLPRRNPSDKPAAWERTAIDRDLADLEKRREDLGWNEIEELD